MNNVHNLVVSEMIKTFKNREETVEEVCSRVANTPKLLTTIYNQVYNVFSSEKSLKKYILKNN